jgi:hypothetical protein
MVNGGELTGTFEALTLMGNGGFYDARVRFDEVHDENGAACLCGWPDSEYITINADTQVSSDFYAAFMSVLA